MYSQSISGCEKLTESSFLTPAPILGLCLGTFRVVDYTLFVLSIPFYCYMRSTDRPTHQRAYVSACDWLGCTGEFIGLWV